MKLVKAVLFLVSFAIANSQTVNWQIYSLEEELGFNPGGVLSIKEDLEGNMWFATPEGLVKFDGNIWSIYDTTNSPLPVNYIWALQVDSANNLWIGTFGIEGGLARLNGSQWRTWQLDQYGIDGTSIFDIEIDNNGYLWMGTYWDGLVKFDGDTTFIIYNGDNSGLLYDQEEINCIAIDDSDNVWYGSDAFGGGVFDQDSTWIHFTPANSIIDGPIYSLELFEDNSVWFGGWNYISMLNGFGSWDSTSYPNVYRYYNIYQYDNNNAIVCTDTGLFNYKIDTKKWYYTYPESYPELKGVGVWGLTTDSNGNLWVGFYNGYIGLVNPDLIVGVDDNEVINHLPVDFVLYQNYPNPFNPTTVIKYAVGKRQYASLKVYDVLGNEVATLVDEVKDVGTYEVEFNAEGLPSGVYFYQLKAGTFVETKKMILLR